VVVAAETEWNEKPCKPRAKEEEEEEEAEEGKGDANCCSARCNLCGDHSSSAARSKLPSKQYTGTPAGAPISRRVR
jgi:hypothetical protein